MQTVVVMEKDVTIMKDLSNGRTEVITMNYTNLKEKMKSVMGDITFQYTYGMRNRRMKLLQGMGFQLKETIFYNSDALHGKIKEVWTRLENNNI